MSSATFFQDDERSGMGSTSPRTRDRGRQRFSDLRRPFDVPDFEVSECETGGESLASSKSERASSFSDGASDSVNEQLHSECYACPVGTVYKAARGMRPETTDRLANAIADLIEIAVNVLDSVAGEGRRARDRMHRVDIE